MPLLYECDFLWFAESLEDWKWAVVLINTRSFLLNKATKHSQKMFFLNVDRDLTSWSIRVKIEHSHVLDYDWSSWLWILDEGESFIYLHPANLLRAVEYLETNHNIALCHQSFQLSWVGCSISTQRIWTWKMTGKSLLALVNLPVITFAEDVLYTVHNTWGFSWCREPKCLSGSHCWQNVGFSQQL